jgi:hypothetical protein
LVVTVFLIVTPLRKHGKKFLTTIREGSVELPSCVSGEATCWVAR